MIDYGKVIRETTNEDGTVRVETTGYFDGEQTTTVEAVREDIKTTHQDWFKDVITALGVVKTDTPEVNIYIKKDKRGNVFLIQKSYVVLKQKNR